MLVHNLIAVISCICRKHCCFFLRWPINEEWPWRLHLHQKDLHASTPTLYPPHYNVRPLTPSLKDCCSFVPTYIVSLYICVSIYIFICHAYRNVCCPENIAVALAVVVHHLFSPVEIFCGCISLPTAARTHWTCGKQLLSLYCCVSVKNPLNHRTPERPSLSGSSPFKIRVYL